MPQVIPNRADKGKSSMFNLKSKYEIAVETSKFGQNKHLVKSNKIHRFYWFYFG